MPGFMEMIGSQEPVAGKINAPDEVYLTLNEIFFSIQGESSFSGRPCIFVRLTGCDLRCTWCDTSYAFHEGKKRPLRFILEEVQKYPCKLVEITGGEPLLHKHTPLLAKHLLDAGYTVLIETSGSQDISVLDRRVVKIVDVKCPGSGESHRNRLSNLASLAPWDELKFVIADEADYRWAREFCEKELRGFSQTVLFSPVFGRLQNQKLAEWILNDGLDVKMQLQMHKYIWDPNCRGV